MAHYDYTCLDCSLEFVISKAMKNSDRGEECPGCGGNSKRVFSPVPGLGLSDGPGCVWGSNKFHKPIFDKPDPHNDIPYTYDKLKSAGKFDNDPKFKRDMDYKMATLKDRPREKVDYQKVGHPIER